MGMGEKRLSFSLQLALHKILSGIIIGAGVGMLCTDLRLSWVPIGIPVAVLGVLYLIEARRRWNNFILATWLPMFIAHVLHNEHITEVLRHCEPDEAEEVHQVLAAKIVGEVCRRLAK